MNIPIFVPHEGCGHSCAFCDQRAITGESRAPSEAEVRLTIERWLSGGRSKAATIAFFGGSFTGIRPELQRRYLSVAREYVLAGRADGIRLSTRPDYIDHDRLALLKEYGVTNVELGAQSMDDGVLRAVNRGHDSDVVRRASELILGGGFTLGLQMMTGLPSSTPEKELFTANEFVRIGANETRIYPTLVMRNTALAAMWQSGQYTPQTVDEAAVLGARLYAIFKKAGVRVLRIGLSDSEALKSDCLAGPYHPAMGELVLGEYIRAQLEKFAEDGVLEVCAPPRYFSRIVGNGRRNAIYFDKKGVKLKLHPSQGEITVNGRTGLCCD